MSADASTSSGGSILTRKTGPLANWIWMALLLLVALAFSMWRRNRDQAVPVDEEQTITEPLPGDQAAPPVFILPQNPQPSVPINITLPPMPAPRPVPLPKPPVGVPPIGTRPPVVPKPVPKPGPPPKPSTPTYVPVKVVKYTDPPGSAGPAWNSTLWGIAKHHGYGAAGNNYLSIWNDPKNASLRTKRGAPTKIQPGDTIYVRRK